MDYVFLTVGFCLVLVLFPSVRKLTQESLWDRMFSPDVEGILEDSVHGALSGKNSSGKE